MKMRSIIKFSLLLPLAGLLMGNQSCDKKAPVVEERQLKKIIEVGKIESRPVLLPDGNVFDFQFVVNQQIYSALHESKAFAFRYNAPLQGLGVMSDGSVLTQLNLSEESKVFFEKTMGKSANQILMPSEDASCLTTQPQARIGGAVTSYAMMGGGGLAIGFNPAGNLNGAGIGANFEMKIFQLEMILRALTPMTNLDLAEVQKVKKKIDMKLSFSLPIAGFNIGPSFFYETPIAQVTRKALNESVMTLRDEFKKVKWSTRVLDMKEGDNLIAIIGGADDVGIQVGDQFVIYRETYYWKGEPCNSELQNESGAFPIPLALVEVIHTGTDLSTTQVIKYFNDFNPNTIKGSRVEISKLMAPIQTEISPAK